MDTVVKPRYDSESK
ncbi:MAG: hypothetical protein MRQ08_06285 [Candidatus Midichloria mitochondrii]|nr:MULTISPECIES: hypothetical protein [spotted fever group]MDJ1288798.1 hypothetical protein [Candidatus Midichloria mitochondrii]